MPPTYPPMAAINSVDHQALFGARRIARRADSVLAYLRATCINRCACSTSMTTCSDYLNLLFHRNTEIALKQFGDCDVTKSAFDQLPGNCASRVLPIRRSLPTRPLRQANPGTEQTSPPSETRRMLKGIAAQAEHFALLDRQKSYGLLYLRFFSPISSSSSCCQSVSLISNGAEP